MSSHYEFLYFDRHGLALTGRSLLSLSGFDWNNTYPKNWKEEEKPKAPFGKMPVLTETRADGSKFVLAESNAINRYVARKAGLFGSNEDEAAHIDQFYESFGEIVSKANPIRKLRETEPEKYAEQIAIFKETVVTPILIKHEEALRKNGTGYYVGDKLSLVDVHVACSLTAFGHLLAIEENYPHLWKLTQKVRSLDAVKAEVERFSMPVRT
jgi:glutathione S-transferase